MSVFTSREALQSGLLVGRGGISCRKQGPVGAVESSALGPCGASKSAGNVHGLNEAMRHAGIVRPSGARIVDGQGGKRSAPETQRMPEARTMTPLLSVEDAATA